MKLGFRRFFLRTFSVFTIIPSMSLFAVAVDGTNLKLAQDSNIQADSKSVHNNQDKSLKKVQDAKVLKVCSDAGFLPFEMKTQKGEWTGFDVEMMNHFSKSLNVDLKMIQISFDGIIPALISGKCDLIAAGMTVTSEREKIVTFSDSTFTSGLSIALKNTEENQDKYKSLEDIDKENNNIAVKTGYTSDIYLSKTLKNARILRFDQDADLVLAVTQGRAKAFVSDTTYVNLMDKDKQSKFLIIPTKVVADSFSVAAKKSSKELMNSFNIFLKSWKESGGYARAEKFYFQDQLWRSQVLGVK
ncbi:transporter substrate-binding domain-containing protein [Fluviispira multicolorata]|uniref:Transporter substrate-binding domain-containing protein n=1 Tax=Fluviispira multicolorata TaxID=2654512 RepID=A0A833N3N0_9BACT|nr:transporter substrate-binding domain-containing protein [Fluviispira multicolorata]KAB8029047.1 transporter substrate-binding domain-containing protein [Fluviispira multicolorata]